MGLTAAVYVIYGTQICLEEFHKLCTLNTLKYYLENGIKSTFFCSYTDQHHDVEYQLLELDERLFICSYVHIHRVLKTTDSPKQLKLPFPVSNTIFQCWCETKGLSRPRLQTVADC